MKKSTTGVRGGQPKARKAGTLALVGCLAMVPAAGMADLSGSIGVASNYVFRGVTLTDDEAQVSGSLDYAHESGFYVGAWASNFAGSTYELDLYAGYGGDLGNGVSYDVSYLLYTFPELDDANYGEVVGSVSYQWFTAGIGYTLNSEVDESAATQDLFVENDLYYFASVGVPLENGWSVGGTVGYYDFDEDGFGGVEASYLHGQVDISKSAGEFGDFTFSLSVTEDVPAAGATGDLLPYVSWTKTF